MCPPAHAAARFQHLDAHATRLQGPGGGNPRGTGADHRNITIIGHEQPATVRKLLRRPAGEPTRPIPPADQGQAHMRQRSQVP